MAKEDFIQNVRSAVSAVLPRVDAEHPYTERDELERILRGDDRWLRGGSVEGFDPEDFEELNPRERDKLERNVESFLRTAHVAPSKPATPHQYDAALPPFLDIVEIVRKAALSEWLEAAGKLTEQAQHWAEGKGWPTKRYPWKLTERFLGTYGLDRLVFGVEGSQMALVPVGRFLKGRGGSFDLAVMPAYESVAIVRYANDYWRIKSLPGESESRNWTESHFVMTAKKLAKMG